VQLRGVQTGHLATGGRMKRETVINLLLILAGIVLAIALFGAGAFWKGKSSPKRSSQERFWGINISTTLRSS